MNAAYSPFKIVHHMDRLEILKNGGQPNPVHVQLIISDLCNENCRFCAYRMDGYTSNQLFGEKRDDGTIDNNPKRFVPLEKCLEILDDCVSMGVQAIQITGGGEPTVHPDHARVFQEVLDRGLKLGLVTNGLVLREKVAEQLLRASWVRFSVDAGTEQTYSETRGVGRAAHGKVWRNVREFCGDVNGESPLVGIGFVITRDNWHEVVLCAEQAKESGARNFRISAVFQPDDERYFEGWHQAAAELCREAETLSDDRFRVFNLLGDRISDLKQHRPDYDFCGVQHLTTYIGADLNVYRCCNTAYNQRGLIGSIRDRRFKDLWKSVAKEQDFASFDARGCERCQFNNKNRTILYALEGDDHAAFV